MEVAFLLGLLFGIPALSAYAIYVLVREGGLSKEGAGFVPAVGDVSDEEIAVAGVLNALEETGLASTEGVGSTYLASRDEIL